MKKKLFLTLVMLMVSMLPGAIRRVSLAWDGQQANGDSLASSISADGRFVAFESFASNLVPGDTNGNIDIFVRDLLLGMTVRASIASDGSEINDGCWDPSISGDGRLVAFITSASNVVPEDTNNAADVFVRDLQAGTTVRVSIDPEGKQFTGIMYANSPLISRDGRWVLFISEYKRATDSCPWPYLFIHDLEAGTTRLFSYTENGIEKFPKEMCFESLSQDQRYLSFSYTSDIIALYDFQTGTIVYANLHPNLLGYPSHALAPDGSLIFINYNMYPQSNSSSRVELNYIFSPSTLNVLNLGTYGIIGCWGGSLASDGCHVLVDIDYSVYLFNWKTGEKRPVSRDLKGNPAPGFYGRLAAGGRIIIFTSQSADMVAGDTNDKCDVFVNETIYSTISVQRHLDRVWLLRLPYNIVSMSITNETSWKVTGVRLYRREAGKPDLLLKQHGPDELPNNQATFRDISISRNQVYYYYFITDLSGVDAFSSPIVSDQPAGHSSDAISTEMEIKESQ